MIDGVRVVSVPVSDQDRTKAFYTDALGFELRTESTFGEGMRRIEVAPEGSTTSLALVTWFEAMPPGSLQGLAGPRAALRVSVFRRCPGLSSQHGC